MMSAFLVEDKTITNIVNWLRREQFLFSEIPYKLKGLGFDMTRVEWEERLGLAMFQLNISGVEARYGKGEAVKFQKMDYHYRPTESVSLAQVLKSLQCWLYQCCEGNVPETKLYKLFDHDVRLYLMSRIIRQLPEYEEAKWG
jgi:hypothetical protein